MISDRYRQLLRTHLDAENEHRMEDTLATLAPDCVFDDRGLGRVWHGREGARSYYRMWWDAFGVKVHTDERHYPSEDLVVVETNFRGVHRGEFLGIQPTARAIDLPFAIFIDLRDDLMGGERFYWDTSRLLRQLGVDTLPSALADPTVELGGSVAR